MIISRSSAINTDNTVNCISDQTSNCQNNWQIMTNVFKKKPSVSPEIIIDKFKQNPKVFCQMDQCLSLHPSKFSDTQILCAHTSQVKVCKVILQYLR